MAVLRAEYTVRPHVSSVAARDRHGVRDRRRVDNSLAGIGPLDASNEDRGQSRSYVGPSGSETAMA